MGGNNNPWFSLEFLRDPGQRQAFIHSTMEHIELTAVSVALGFILAFALALMVRRYPRFEGLIVGAADTIYSVPSIALFSLLLPFTGLSMVGPIIGLVLYTQLILVRAILDGLRSVPASAVEAAEGLGYGGVRRLLTVEMPLALPTIFGGARVATVSTVGQVIAAFALSHGGLGETLTVGYSNNLYKQEVVDAVVGIIVIALAFDVLILVIGKLVTRWNRIGRGATS